MERKKLANPKPEHSAPINRERWAAWMIAFSSIGVGFLVRDYPVYDSFWIVVALLLVTWRYRVTTISAIVTGAFLGTLLRRLAFKVHVNPWLLTPLLLIAGYFLARGLPRHFTSLWLRKQ